MSNTKKFKKAKKYITEKAKELRACSEEYKKALSADNYDDLISVVRENCKWSEFDKLLNNELSLKHFGVSLLNLLNSGVDNSGYRNSGDWNSGDWNSGDRNSGYRNSGDRNSGDRNSGYRNSGYRNSGDRNSGDWNSGDRNSGYRNSGDWNSGDWNSGDRNSGFFNSTKPDTINIFNKPCKHEDWENAKKPDFIYNINITEWISFSNMTDDKKKQYPKAFVCDGYLKRHCYKHAWKTAFDKASEIDIELLKALPNWDAKVFEEITGLEIA